MLGISEEYEHFDIDIITHINSTFSILAQLGVGPDKGFLYTIKLQNGLITYLMKTQHWNW